MRSLDTDRAGEQAIVLEGELASEKVDLGVPFGAGPLHGHG